MRSGRTTQTEKVRKLRALARSSNKHEAALALERAQALEPTTAKAIAHDIAQRLAVRGLIVHVQRRGARGPQRRSKVDASVRFYCSRARRSWFAGQFDIEITEYPAGV